MSNEILITKRNGNKEKLNLDKIIKAVARHAEGLNVNASEIAIKTISGIGDGTSTRDLDMLSIKALENKALDHPDNEVLSVRIFNTYISKEVHYLNGVDIQSFSQSIELGHQLGLINDRVYNFVEKNARKLNQAIDEDRTNSFKYIGISTLYTRYLKKHPKLRTVIETPQYFFMRVAVSLTHNVKDAIDLYNLMSLLDYLPSTPTLLNSGALHEQLSSCYLLDSPHDSIKGIYNRYLDVALLSKYAGGVGVSFSRVRSRGSFIEGINGFSQGIIPWIKTLNSSVDAVQQGGVRRGAACVYLETWHPDIMEFLELRDNTGHENKRAHDLNFANWVPDLFMKRVEANENWSLFDPKDVPDFPDLYGEDFEKAYIKAEKDGLAKEQIPAITLYERMIRSLGETGNGWMNFKDRSNLTSNQVVKGKGNVIHLSNLCTEILEVSTEKETAVCNLGSVNLSNHVVEKDGKLEFDFKKLEKTVKIAVKQLDRVIDINFYPIDGTKVSNDKWRPVGLGVMGLHDVFFKLKMVFGLDDAIALSTKILQTIYFNALSESVNLAKIHGPHPSFNETKLFNGELAPDVWVKEGRAELDYSVGDWDQLRKDVKEHGARNSLMVAIAPTATIASIAGCYECIEPQVSNVFKKETLSGDFFAFNKYLVKELIDLGIWDSSRQDIIALNGSIQGLDYIPEDIKVRYKTAWEISMRSVIKMAAARSPYVDQSQSMNLFIEAPNVSKLASMYLFAWKSGIKTSYYLRSRPASNIAKTFVQPKKEYTIPEAIACSLENPEHCEACQ